MTINPAGLKRFPVLIPLAFFVVIIGCFHRLPGLTTDGQIYLQIARNLHYGIGLGWQALWFPPLHSILIALVAWLPGAHDLQFAASIAAAVMGLLLTMSAYSLAAGIFNRTVGVMAAVVVLSFPHIIDMHFSAEAEITYTAFLLASLALLLASFRRNSYPLAILTGISFSLAYMSRSEGFLVMVMTLGVLCAAEGVRFYRTRTAGLCLVVIVVCLITASPYLFFLQKHDGAFVISPKATYVMIWMKSKIYHDNDKGETDNDELWGLSPEGKLKWQEPSGIGELAGFLMSHPSKSISVYLHNLALELPGRIPNSGGTQRFPQVYPLYVALLALMASFRRWGDSSALKKGVLFAPLLILLILPVFTEGWYKYLLPYAPLLIIAACGGLFLAIEWLSVKAREPRLRTLVQLTPLVMLALLSSYYLSLYISKPSGPISIYNAGRNKYAEEARTAALVARERFGPGRNYMLPWNSKMIYHLDGLWTPMPVTDYLRSLQFAQDNNVDFVIWEFMREVDDAELEPLPGLRRAGVYRSKANVYTVAFYEVLR